MSERYWTQEQIAYLTAHYATMHTDAISKVIGRNCCSIQQKARSLGLKKSDAIMQEVAQRRIDLFRVESAKLHKFWTEQEDAYMKAHYPNEYNYKIAKVLGRSDKSVYNRAHILGLAKSEAFNAKFMADSREHILKVGYKSRKQKGDTPWNKGKKGYMGANTTSFAKGMMPHNHSPVGTIVYRAKEMEHRIKIAEPKLWVSLHAYLWLESGQDIPRGCKVVFRDGNRDNITLGNLECITSANLLARNAKRSRQELPTELSLLQQAVNKLNRTISKNNKK